MIIIQNGTLVTPEGELRSSCALSDGKIVKIGEIAPGPEDEVIDASGCYVYPGFIDGHTHLDLPVAGTETAGNVHSGTTAGLGGGRRTCADVAAQ